MNEKQFPKISASSANSTVKTEVSPLGYPTELFAGEQTFESINATIGSIVLQDRQPRSWLFGFLIACGLLALFFVAVSWLLIRGVGIWGINIPVAWAFAIINFVWWIGLAHAGTFISAMLLLMFQHWRSAINRFAESMTLFAIVCAGIFPILHLGRPWVFYWIFPYPDTMGMWPQFRSPLVWDAFAIGTYFVISVLFWFLGLLPDLATVRDRARKHWQKNFYGLLALGWRNSAAHWQEHQTAYMLLAGLATPLVLSVHTIVSLDFAIAHVPGWHSTMFPPYFVAGAIYSGLAMVLTIVVPIRNVYRLENLITLRHFNNMANVMLAAGLIVAYGYFIETFMAFYSGDRFAEYAVANRVFGPYGWIFWALMFFNVVVPQSLWSPRIRRTPIALFLVAVAVDLGMWVERFVIIVPNLHRDFLPSAWRMFFPTVWDWATLFGSIGVFLTLLFLFIRFLPMISISESRELIAGPQKATTT
jgi:molybdopterin-containing oxidoreductase family membrane subunit